MLKETAPTVTVNGKAETLPQVLSVTEFLQTKGIAAGSVAVEVNLNIIPRSEQSSYLLKAGDVIEIVRFVGGGA